MKYIAVDYGETRTGLAECDPGEVIVTPITPQIEEKSMNKAAQAAADAARARGAEALVAGLPKIMDGTEGPRAELYRAFGDLLAQVTGLTVGKAAFTGTATTYVDTVYDETDAKNVDLSWALRDDAGQIDYGAIVRVT